MSLSKGHLDHFSDLASASTTIAEGIYNDICKSSEYRLAIPGGRSPGPILRELRDRFLLGAVEQIQKLRLYWIDERCVPPGHPDSNFGQAAQEFISPLQLSPKAYFRIRGELGARAAASQYNELLGTLLDGGSHIDCALIGMGEDGHIASLFPGAPELKSDHAWAVPAFPESARHARVSVTYPFFARSVLRNVVLAFGDAKAAVLRCAVGHSSVLYPVSLLPYDQGNVRIATDLRIPGATQ